MLEQEPLAISPRIRFGWIGESWRLLLAEPLTWIVSSLIMGFIIAAVSVGTSSLAQRAGYVAVPATTPELSLRWILGELFGASVSPRQLVLFLPNIAVEAFLYGGIYRIAVEQLRGNTIGIAMLFGGARRFPAMFGYLSIIRFGLIAIYHSAIVLGLARHSDIDLFRFFLGAVILEALLYPFFQPGYALVADGVPIVAALRRSFRAIASDWPRAIVFGIILGVVSFSGFLACGVGAFLTFPLIYIVPALMYRDMIGLPVGPKPPSLNSLSRSEQGDRGVWPPPPSGRTPLS